MLSLRENVPLAPFTTFGIGGLAEFFVVVRSESDMAEAIRLAREKNVPIFFLGGGSNVLFSDAGWKGLVARIECSAIRKEGETGIVAESGAKLFDVVSFARDMELSGLERLAGIPGSFGGAIRGNAGAFGAAISDTLVSVRALPSDSLEIEEFSRDAGCFQYRESCFKRNPSLIILSARLLLQKGMSREALTEIMEKTMRDRESKHPQNVRCGGSFFMNPVVSDEELRHEFELDTGQKPKDEKLPAGWLIDHAGLRGKQVGGAKLSDIHPNYLVNTGEATAEDVMILSSIVKQRVRTQFGIQLREEVQIVGF